MPDKFIHRINDNDDRHGYDLKAKPINAMLNLKQFCKSELHLFEDNLEYISGFCSIIPRTIAHYIPSKQGY